ncbi:hypothetical protein NDU88_000905 [Pleurodeles waltl]|uniref:Uncharacterized protein n=1 Tax=Pleurodeles waltl TaxID=8319 RepID=A0AAV7TGS5_PLEWA|nr:hypothetical protein NDU88_000905 [Pleurodeles waltl]
MERSGEDRGIEEAPETTRREAAAWLVCYCTINSHILHIHQASKATFLRFSLTSGVRSEILGNGGYDDKMAEGHQQLKKVMERFLSLPTEGRENFQKAMTSQAEKVN